MVRTMISQVLDLDDQAEGQAGYKEVNQTTVIDQGTLTQGTRGHWPESLADCLDLGHLRSFHPIEETSKMPWP